MSHSDRCVGLRRVALLATVAAAAPAGMVAAHRAAWYKALPNAEPCPNERSS